MRLAIVVMIGLVLGACAETPPPTPAEPPAAVPRIGVVGLIQQHRERGINKDNWKDALVGIIRNDRQDTGVNVVAVRWEVTVFYDAGQQEVVVVDEKPDIRPGQRVRVTGNKIEPLASR
jgi:hypothetical protein